MKKTAALLISLIMIFALVACGPVTDDNPDVKVHQSADGTVTYVGFEKAAQIAINSIGMEKKEAKKIEAKVDFDEEEEVYDVEFHAGKMDHDFEIDAVTGEILEHDVDVNFGY